MRYGCNKIIENGRSLIKVAAYWVQRTFKWENYPRKWWVKHRVTLIRGSLPSIKRSLGGEIVNRRRARAPFGCGSLPSAKWTFVTDCRVMPHRYKNCYWTAWKKMGNKRNRIGPISGPKKEPCGWEGRRESVPSLYHHLWKCIEVSQKDGEKHISRKCKDE